LLWDHPAGHDMAVQQRWWQRRWWQARDPSM